MICLSVFYLLAQETCSTVEPVVEAIVVIWIDNVGIARIRFERSPILKFDQL